ncbi:MAG: hypothetical protein A2020_15030 [Lentisphaerae bacterium GWF2_45_14]|nr:MAG: hypothetical protein A2020_15030 [Lentisphaerae bacterium GWF2_45_14]
MKGKYYLNGIDWIAQGLHVNCRRGFGGGYQFLIVTELEAPPAFEHLKNVFEKIADIFPVLLGKLKRHPLNLAPYWMPGKSAEGKSAGIEHCSAENMDALHIELEHFLNEPFKINEPLIGGKLFDLKQGNSFFACKYDHRIFDAGGGELFLELLNQLWNEAELKPDKYQRKKGPWLNEWSHQFECGRTVIRLMRNLYRQGTASVFYKKGYSGGGTRFRQLLIDGAAFKRLENESARIAGPMMLTVYLYARIQNCLHDLLHARGEDNPLCLCPMSVEMRTTDDDELFFNHWSVMTMYSRHKDFDSVENAVGLLKEQFYENIKNKSAYCFSKANLLVRILPLPITSLIASKPFRGTAGTAMTAMLNRGNYAGTELFGCKVKNLYHVPAMPPHPGLGIFMNRRGDSLNLTLSWLDGVINEAELAVLSESLHV